MSSKRGRPARKFDANRIIEIVMDLYESPRVHRRPVCLSQATLPDSFKLS